MNLVQTLVIIFSVFYNESLCYLLFSCTDPIFEKNLAPDIWAKMLSAN